ncbi:hypothetical protein D8L93_10105 [Sodalis-like symbiont of Bactericera trigonica]|nr:hypothetical protein D8L93_10105 [Sodalis-like symbiont of Bactericera trigonica]
MKLMIASDIHGSLAATRRLLAEFDLSGARWLLLLGDFLNHGPRNPLPEDYRPAEVAAALKEAEREGEHILFNPSSVSLPKGGYPASYGLLADGRLHVVALDGGETIA